MIYIVRSERERDNPTTQFVTRNKEVVDAVLTEQARLQYEKDLQNRHWQAKHYEEQIAFYDFRLSRGETLDKWQQESYETDKKRLEAVTTERVLTFDEWRTHVPEYSNLANGERLDWYVETVPEIESVEEALAHHKENISFAYRRLED